MTTPPPSQPNSLAEDSTTPLKNGPALQPANKNEGYIFGTIYLSNANREGPCNLFNRHAIQLPVVIGNSLLEYIWEDIEPRELVHQEVTVNYERYERISTFPNESGVNAPSTIASGEMIINRIIHNIWNRAEDVIERDKAIVEFEAIKRAEYFSPSPSNRSPKNTRHSIPTE